MNTKIFQQYKFSLFRYSVLQFAIIYLGIGVFSACNRTSKLVSPPVDSTGVIQVSNFGAKGDGRHDDSGAIQNAINHLSKNGGGVLTFEKNKKYLIRQTLTLTSGGITMDLNGSVLLANSMKVNPTHENNPAVLCSGRVAHSKHVVLLNGNDHQTVKIQWPYPLSPGDYVRISNKELMQNARNYYFKTEFLKVLKTDGQFITLHKPLLDYTGPVLLEQIEYLHRVNVINGSILCSKKNRSTGLMFDYVLNSSAKNVKVEGTSVAGINFHRSVHCEVDSCTVLSPSPTELGLDYGILFTNSQYCRAKNNFLQTTTTGVDLSLSHFINIEHNTTENCGISPHAGTEVIIQDNILKNGTIYFRSYNSTIIRNKISIVQSGLGGIVLAEINGKGNILIEQNEISFENLSNGNVQKGESFGTAIYSGEVDLDSVSIINNVIKGADKGIAIFRADNANGNKNLRIENNRIENCKDYGINASRYSNVLIKGNYVSGNFDQTIGIFLWESGGLFENIEIIDNVIEQAHTGMQLTKGYKARSLDKNTGNKIKSKKINLKNE